MDKTESDIRHNMEQTRAALTEKLEMIEERVQEKVEGATATVGDALDTVGDAVGRVKQTFDLRYQMAHHPWAAFGGALFAGFALGRVTGSGSRVTYPAGDMAVSPALPLRAHESGPGAMRQATVSAAELLRDLGVMEILREMVKEVLPKFVPKIERAFGLTVDGLRHEAGAAPHQPRVNEPRASGASRA